MLENNSNSAVCIAERAKSVLEKVNLAAQESGRSTSEVTLMAVTKTRTAAQIAECLSAGISVIGENRAQEFRDKSEFFSSHGLETHIIGHLQNNKVKYVAGVADYIDSVDSLETARLISQRAQSCGRVQKVMTEVNIGRDPNKWGVAPEALYELLCAMAKLPGINVRGLMTILPITGPEETEKLFLEMKKLFVDIKNEKIDNICVDYLSMGMSHDYETAIRCGANLVRVGTAIFG